MKKKTRRRRPIWEASRVLHLRKILIVESVKPSELYEECREGWILSDLLRIIGIDSIYRECVDMACLKRAMREAQGKEVDALHISCHGDQHGLVLTSKEKVNWESFSEMAGTVCITDCCYCPLVIPVASSYRSILPCRALGQESLSALRRRLNGLMRLYLGNYFTSGSATKCQFRMRCERWPRPWT